MYYYKSNVYYKFNVYIMFKICSIFPHVNALNINNNIQEGLCPSNVGVMFCSNCNLSYKKHPSW